MSEPTVAEVEQWSRRELDVDPSTPSEDCRVAALRLVKKTDFQPSLEDAIAIGVALGRCPNPTAAFVQEAYFSRDEAALGKAIDEFSTTFFQIPPDDRAKRWAELRTRSAVFPWWQGRLNHLRRGLLVERPESPAGRFADMVFELFPMSAAARAIHRRRFADQMRDDPVPLDEASAFLRAYPDLSRLANELLADAGAARGSPTVPRSPRIASEPSRSASATRTWPAWTLLIAVFFVIRLLMSLGSSSSRPPEPVRHVAPLPPLPRPDAQAPRWRQLPVEP